MNITKNHLDFWQAKKAPMPHWASNLQVAQSPRPKIHSLINSQVKGFDRYDPRFLVERTMKILKGTQKREGSVSLRKMLLKMSVESDQRAHMAVRWLHRLAHQDADYSRLARMLSKDLDRQQIVEILADELDEPVHLEPGQFRFENYGGMVVDREGITPFVEKALKKMHGVRLTRLMLDYL